jgi:hypothetical protein
MEPPQGEERERKMKKKREKERGRGAGALFYTEITPTCLMQLLNESHHKFAP